MNQRSGTQSILSQKQGYNECGIQVQSTDAHMTTITMNYSINDFVTNFNVKDREYKRVLDLGRQREQKKENRSFSFERCRISFRQNCRLGWHSEPLPSVCPLPLTVSKARAGELSKT